MKIAYNKLVDKTVNAIMREIMSAGDDARIELYEIMADAVLVAKSGVIFETDDFSSAVRDLQSGNYAPVARFFKRAKRYINARKNKN